MLYKDNVGVTKRFGKVSIFNIHRLLSNKKKSSGIFPGLIQCGLCAPLCSGGRREISGGEEPRCSFTCMSPTAVPQMATMSIALQPNPWVLGAWAFLQSWSSGGGPDVHQGRPLLDHEWRKVPACHLQKVPVEN